MSMNRQLSDLTSESTRETEISTLFIRDMKDIFFREFAQRAYDDHAVKSL